MRASTPNDGLQRHAACRGIQSFRDFPRLFSRADTAAFAFHPLSSAYAHLRTLPISQRSPQPFYRAKLESPQPPHAQRNLDEPDDNGEEQAKRGSDLAEKGEAVAIEDHGADERLKQIVAERHAPDRRKWRQPPQPGLILSQENNG